MDNLDKITKLIEENNGMITSSILTKERIPRHYLKKLVDAGVIMKVDRGIYCKVDMWEDEMYALQSKYTKGIFSHETALYIHGFTDRTPIKYVMTFPSTYNVKSLKQENVRSKKAIKDIYELGVTYSISPCGNKIKIYDLEKTLCDIVRGNNTCDIQIVNAAMKQYAASNKKDISKLMDYAEKLRVKNKIYNYMEVLL